MKKSVLFIFAFLLVVFSVIAQPQLMNYQGVARDKAGQVVSNQQIALQISILTNNSEGPIVYSEIHQITTTQFGVFSIHIGAGVPVNGNFADIAWATDNHFAKVEMDINGGSNFQNMGITQLLSVPYAFHAQTAGSLFNQEKSVLKGGKLPGVPSQNWSLFGNQKTDPDKDKLGTTDETDLVFVTNNIERLRITADGKLITADGVGLELGGNLAVNGDSTYIGKDLFVGRNVFLNVDESFNPQGETVNYGNFTVEGLTKLNSALHVYGETALNNKLRVEEDAYFAKALNVDGYFTVNNNKFEVDGGTGNTKIAGDLAVIGNTNFNGDLEVNGEGKFANLTIINDVPDDEYLATFENTNDGDGDGIKIKLGKASANNGLNAFDLSYITDKAADMKNLIDCDYTGNKGELLLEIVAVGLAEDVGTIVGLAAGIGDMVTAFINSELGLPLLFPGITVPSINVPKLTTPQIDLTVVTVPSLTVTNGFNIYSGNTFLANHQLLPEIPRIDLVSFSELFQGMDLGGGITVPDDFSIEKIDPTDLSFWGVPDFCITDNVNDPLNNKNEFITFSDFENKTMGAVRAESVEDWKNNYLFSPLFLYKLYRAINSAMDKKHARYHFTDKIFEASVDYYKTGVEYSSGNGDYAEWLERVNPDEIINAGDIVAVTGGKITKDLINAEQVMAVSTRPIVLGNTPLEGKTHLGNNIAFMGQIPVKIMGAVSTGDYIVAKGEIAGYGIAVSSENMTLEDFKFAVGRAWEENADKGPKMVNTVIGVHNGDYLNILKRYEQKFRESESRMQAVEAKIDILTGLISEKHKIN